MPTLSNLVGEKFSDLTIIERTSERRRGNAVYRCLCVCGKETFVPTSNLRSGITKSCGCRKIRVHIKHNLSRHRSYQAWHNMNRRCYDTTDISFPYYGKRGIKVCDEWLPPLGIIQFVKDMGERPQGKSIDRIDNNKGYSKENCRWATNIEQQANTSQNHFITFQGETLCIAEWSRRIGIRADTMRLRVKRGLSVDQVLFKGHFSTRPASR